MAEELAFKQRLDNGRTIQHHITSRGYWTQAVKRSGHHILARARLAGNEHSAKVRGDSADSKNHLTHHWAAADDALEFRIGQQFAL
jgi:hypothetical protein